MWCLPTTMRGADRRGRSNCPSRALPFLTTTIDESQLSALEELARLTLSHIGAIHTPG